MNNDSQQPQPSVKKAKEHLHSNSSSGRKSGSSKGKPPTQSNTPITKYFTVRSSPEKKADEPKQPSEPTSNPLQTRNVGKPMMAPSTPLPKLSDMPFTMFGSSTTSPQLNGNPAGLASNKYPQTNSPSGRRKTDTQFNQGLVNSTSKRTLSAEPASSDNHGSMTPVLSEKKRKTDEVKVNNGMDPSTIDETLKAEGRVEGPARAAR